VFYTTLTMRDKLTNIGLH